ncbi:MAG: SAM-dependent methyltransferase [Caulobacteraceae bacterium]
MSLAEKLARRIVAAGPIAVADYMGACLHDPEYGYYTTRPALGAAGDFVTAPHVSQMFGEILGLWAVDTWRRIGRPRRARLVEMGPGDGTMLGDMLRAARVDPAFLAAVEVWLVETSAPLRQAQARALAGRPARWVESLAAVPADLPVILVANEFLDCLPIDQLVRTADGWRERRVGVDGGGALAFVIAGPACSDRAEPADAASGSIREVSDALADMGAVVGGVVSRTGGAALFIDYGRDRADLGDTLQALRGHEKHDPLEGPGAADLTAHVDFPAFIEAACGAGGAAAEIRSQRAFLRTLGIDARAAALSTARPDLADTIGRQLERLIGEEAMGLLFKAVCVHAPGLSPPGFEGAG